MGTQWVIEEFGGVDLGDERRNERLIELTTALSDTPGGAFSRAFPDDTSMRAATRFFDNHHFDDADILSAHQMQTLARFRPHPLIYCPQDTTSINYETLEATEGLGKISKSERTQGLLVHSSLGVTPGRVALGLLHQRIWARSAERRTANERKQIPIEEKESFKWIEGLRALNALAPHCPDTTLVSICDREGDIYNMFAEPREENVELLIRATHDRATQTDEGTDRVWQEMRSAPVAAQIIVNVPRQGTRAARQAHLDVHFKSLRIRESKSMRDNKALSTGVGEVRIWAVLAEEKHPPKAVKQPIRWLLYSTRPITTAKEAVEAVDAYSVRWVIEVWHKALKSGLKIEDKQAKEADRLARSLTVQSIIAWRILYIMSLSRSEPDLPCTVCFEEDEWKAAWCRHHRTPRVPASPPGLRDFVRMLCRVSGFMGRKNEGEPGVKRISMALDYLTQMTDTYRALTQSS